MSYRLRDGSVTQDRRLDRLIEFDERSRQFAVEPSRADTQKMIWALDERNDQGAEGACVGFGTGHDLAAAPVEVEGITNAWSQHLYEEAKKIDPWPGEDYEGTSVLAGIKVAQNMGFVESYRWCFTLDDYIQAILTEGPVLVGTWWKDSMWGTQPDGYLDTSGENVGGHCFILRGVDVPNQRFLMTNSWGQNWGFDGEAYISFESWEKDLMPEGEGAVLYEGEGSVPPTPADGGLVSKILGFLASVVRWLFG